MKDTTQQDEWAHVVSMARLIEGSVLLRDAGRAEMPSLSYWPIAVTLLLVSGAFALDVYFHARLLSSNISWLPIGLAVAGVAVAILGYCVRPLYAFPIRRRLPNEVMRWEQDMPFLSVLKAAYGAAADDVPFGAKQVALKLKDGEKLSFAEALVYVKALRKAAKQIRIRDIERRFETEVLDTKLLPAPSA